MYGPRPIRFPAHWCADYSKYRGFLAGGISTASSLLPFFGTLLRRQKFNLAAKQYRQLRRLQARGFAVPFYFVQDRKSSSSVPMTHLHPLPPKERLSYTLLECLFYLFFFIFCFLRHRFSIASCQFAGYIHSEYG